MSAIWKRSFALLLSSSLIVLATACSNNKSSGSPDPSTNGKIDIFTDARTVKVGDTVSLAAKVENSSEQVAWSIASGPGSLSSATGSETEYVATASGQAQIKACAGGPCAQVGVRVVSPEGGGEGDGGGDGDGDGDGDGSGNGGGSEPEPPATITVSGLVLNEDGHPVENQSVYVLGDENTLTATDLDGKFTIENIVPPYNLVMTEDHLNRVFIYKGLTRPDPVLYVFEQEDQTAVPPQSVEMIGQSLGGDVLGPFALDRTFLGFASPEVPMGMDLERQNWDTALPAVPGPYDLQVAWNAASPVTQGTLLAAEYRIDPNTGAPANWWYAVQPGVTLLSGQVLAGPTLTLMPVEADTTQGTISVPPLYSVFLKNLSFSLQGGIFFPVFWDDVSLSQQGNYYYVAPHVDGASTQVCAIAYDTVPAFCNQDVGCSISATCVDALAARTTDAEIKILKAPEPSNPVNGANVVNLNTPFRWSAFEGGVHNVRLVPADGAVGPSYYIFTDANSVKIPDVRAVTGLALDSAIQYAWYVVGYAPYSDMDAFTAGIPASSLLFTFTPEADIPLGDNGVTPDIGQYPLPPVPNASAAVGIEYLFRGCFGGC